MITGNASPGLQLGAPAEMMAARPPVPAQPPTPKVPVPLDELLKVASEFSEGGRFPEAERILHHILSAAPDQPQALHQKGVLLFRMGRHEAAAEMVERAISLAPIVSGAFWTS